MKIGQFVIKFPIEGVETYGSENITYLLCRELVKIGNEVTIFVPWTSNEKRQFDGINVNFYHSILKFHSYYFSYRILFDSLKTDLDVVHIHNDSPMAILAGIFCAKWKKIPAVITWHGDWIGSTYFQKKMIKILNELFIKSILSQADAIIVPSISYVDESNVLQKYTEKIIEIPHGIDLNRFTLPYSKQESKQLLKLDESKVLILFVGSISEGKGVNILLEAISKIVPIHNNISFVFVGGGEVDRFRDHIKTMKLGNYVILTGYITEKEKLLYYNSADIFIFPSISKHEVFPVVLLEASGFGLPIVASDLNTLKNIIKDGYNGLLFKTGDSDDLADKIGYLLKNEKIGTDLGNNAKNIVRSTFNSHSMAIQTFQLYSDLIKKSSLLSEKK